MEAAQASNNPEKVDLLGIPVSSRSFVPDTELGRVMPGSPLIVTFVNPNACVVSEQHADYVGMLRRFDWVLCDGIGMVLAARHIRGISVDRAAFDLTSLARPVCHQLADRKIPLVIVGGRPGVSERAAVRLQNLFPGLVILATFDGYDNSPEKAIEFIKTHKDSAVLSAMGAPEQERFLIRLKTTGWHGIGFTCGGFLDQLLERVDYYPEWVDRSNLRFLYRLFKEPHRLWKRYLIDYQVFLRRYAKAYFLK